LPPVTKPSDLKYDQADCGKPPSHPNPHSSQHAK
ncbi:unnamed protein product, partial [Rotaria magnacalcarata]